MYILLARPTESCRHRVGEKACPGNINLAGARSQAMPHSWLNYATWASLKKLWCPVVNSEEHVQCLVAVGDKGASGRTMSMGIHAWQLVYYSVQCSWCSTAST